jgi:hypothetical protein
MAHFPESLVDSHPRIWTKTKFSLKADAVSNSKSQVFWREGHVIAAAETEHLLLSP